MTEPGRDRALTLPPARLAGSGACLNCGTQLEGPFCHYCGQPDRNFLRFFPALLREFMQDTLDLDSRLARTLTTLLFKPGRLTRDYLAGRRFRYTPPIRLYLFSSIIFFLLAALLSAETAGIDVRIGAEDGAPSLRISSEQAPQLSPEVAARLASGDAQQLIEAIESGAIDVEDLARATGPEHTFTTDQFLVDGKPWDRDHNPFVLDFMPDFVNDWINDEIAESPAKARQIGANPNLFVEQIRDILPGALFVLLPLVALLFKFWYLFARRYYIEHLILTLHYHAFVFVSLSLVLPLNGAQPWFAAHDIAWGATASAWLAAGLLAWIPIYLLLALRVVYRQNWFLTVLKFGAIGTSYVTLLGLVSGLVAVLGFVLL
ncbi:MAG: DUF3667 domain-containing protein [Xanthomonadales bacterium]|nr:DUF3667 domain-containing protein [Xanthomonadales bacterium]NIN60002.1 DUF3667 domain-containing protein [Xanthomonadales bacterium]NIN75370.1 DUF3667 domain-containing protein [Xanthomonadales bacterium]NIO14193.1 DUF3667 domain-containing protein [Xanthomonadales bacterium]NIP12395.1 DUF3667 domain-containing protein [Xanthomonadales bacterium]